MSARRFDFRIDPALRPLLVAFGVVGGGAWVDLTPDLVDIRFGLYRFRIERANVAEASLTGPYRWYRVVGIRMSLADRGLSFGSSTSRGVCMLLRAPVPGIGPFRLLHHPGVTVTVEQPERFLEALHAPAP